MTETQEQTPRKHVRGSKKKTAAKASAKTTAKTVKSGAKATATRKRAGKGANTTPQYGENAAKGKKLATSDTNDTNRIAPPKYRKGSMRIVPLGGLGEIGRNMNVIEYNGHILLIDCGVLFPEEEQPGVDLILPDFNYIKDRLDKVDALVLTHGHEDHIGGVPYLLKLRKDIPLIGSKLTLGFVEAKCKEHHIEPETIQVEGRDKLKVGPFNLEFVTVTHSIPDALAVCVRTPAGSLIDTGDIKLDQLPLDHRVTDLVEFGKLGEQGIDLLMMDSTNAEVPGFVKPETSIGPALDQVFATATRKIIVASFSSHVHRVQQVVDAAHKYGRKVVFVRIADGNHRDITINEFDTVILASSLIPGNEHGVYKVINKLVQLGARVVNRDNAAVHVSGHCNEGELLYMYNIVKPKNAMPIHGENRHLVANGLIAVKTGIEPENVVLAEDGDVVDLYHGKAAIVGSVPCGYIYVDGDSVGELTDDELEKRRILGSEGFVSCFAVVDTDAKDVISGPKVYLNAVAEDEKSFEKVRHQIIEQLQDAMMGGTKDVHKLQQIMRRTLGSWVARELHRKPMIVPVVADVAADMESMETYSD